MKRHELTRNQLLGLINLLNDIGFSSANLAFRESLYKNKKKLGTLISEPMEALFPNEAKGLEEKLLQKLNPFFIKDESGNPKQFEDESGKAVLKIEESKMSEATEARLEFYNENKETYDKQNKIDQDKIEWLNKKIVCSLYDVSIGDIPEILTYKGENVTNSTMYYEYLLEMLVDIKVDTLEDDGKEI